MKTLGNILWIIFGGFLLWLEWVFAGIMLCITIVGIPLGIQCFKIGGLCLAPFGKEIVHEDIKFGNTFMNIIWIIIFGWEIALTALICGAVWCITIAGIPFGKQFFKLAAVSLFPFGTRAVRI